MEFLKLSDLTLNPAGYLVNKKSEKPVNHEMFVKQQRAAEFTVKLAKAIKDKNFKCAKVDDFDTIKNEVLKAINEKNVKQFVATPTKPVSKVNEELVQYALDFVAFEEKKADADKINKLMAEFDIMDAVENVGDYFSEGLVKLNRIYSVSEVLEAIQIHTEKLK